ncbi:DUF572-domain-containing protein [Mytilinidion resinicola]|uniref:DUF572-domain-containing protein n=1 Tax=Mytilinidion resinicola TaxID=574789 RepID=A0A6A6Y3K1_9PEZI|nr:DUF572-domain-containing protein [Mytilinidion resinicola]KAF2802805.1 DUF572-domain-containing protein [Mytilinidion resinicola]
MHSTTVPVLLRRLIFPVYHFKVFPKIKKAVHKSDLEKELQLKYDEIKREAIRTGFNMGRYYPPSASSAPSFNKSHPLGARARKLPQGILTVRFEMPFALFCEHCKPEVVIGQGVRFNAEKKKVGNYYSTPVWSFRMKHTICGGWIEIRTNPKEGKYEVIEGARRRDGREEEEFGALIFGDELADGEGAMLTEEERERRRTDAFAALEGNVGEKQVEKKSKERIEELVEAQERAWQDPDAVNRRLRRGFRAERKVLEKRQAHTEGMQERFGIGFEIVDEVEGDRIRAGVVEFGELGVGDVGKAVRKPLFASEASAIKAADVKKSGKGDKKTRAAREAEKRRELLQHELRGNTRAVMDPFLTASPRSSNNDTTLKVIAGIKRKRTGESEKSGTSKADQITTPRLDRVEVTSCRQDVLKPPPLLVAYDSD